MAFKEIKTKIDEVQQKVDKFRAPDTKNILKVSNLSQTGSFNDKTKISTRVFRNRKEKPVDPKNIFNITDRQKNVLISTLKKDEIDKEEDL